MKFSDRVVKFEFAGVPMVGNLANGYSIGLSENGNKLCSRLFNEDLDENTIVAADSLLAKHLIEGGFFDEFGELTSLQAAYLHITQRCNLDCAGCYSYNATRNKQEDPSLNMLINAVKELSSCGVKSLIISGGEPFLRKDLAELVAYAKTQCHIQSITVATNGTILDVDLLRRIRPYVDIVSVSFDGSSNTSPAHIRGKQRFDQLIELIEAMQYLDIETQILPTLHGKNLDEMQAYHELAKRFDVRLSYSLLSGSPFNKEITNLLPDEEALACLGEQTFVQGIQNNVLVQDAPISMNLSVCSSCGAGKEMISIASDGSVYPCHMMHDEDFLFGNVFLKPLSSILAEVFVKDFLHNMSTNDEKCNNCSYALFCGGGCKARSYMTNKKLNSCDPYCTMFKAFYRNYEGYLVEQMNQRQRKED